MHMYAVQPTMAFVVRSEFRRQFRRHVIWRTEHDVGRDAEFLQEPPAGFDEAWSAVKAICLEPKAAEGNQLPAATASGNQNIEPGRKKRSIASRSRGKGQTGCVPGRYT